MMQRTSIFSHIDFYRIIVISYFTKLADTLPKIKKYLSRRHLRKAFHHNYVNTVL